MSNPSIAVVADDLTGAGDTAVQFVRAGWRTELQLTPAASSTEVIAVTTDSRALPADRAAEAVAEAVRELRGAGTGLLYKKVDSTLRGPVRAEIDGVLSAWAADAVAVVCPAFPANGRTVRDGVLLVDGTEVHRTDIGRDPVAPVAESRIDALLGADHVHLTGADPRQDAEQLRSAGPVVVVDAETEADLDRVAAAVTELGPDAVPVGSAGLASRLARTWASQGTPGPALVMVTSRHQTTRAQVARLAAEPGTRMERPGPGELADEDAWHAWGGRVLDRFDPAAQCTVLVVPEDHDGALHPADVARRFGALAAKLVEHHRISGLVVTGGDGARALAQQLQARAISLTGEVAPGIPVGTVSGGPRQGHPIVTKAGGFGSPTALLEAARAVRHTKGHHT